MKDHTEANIGDNANKKFKEYNDVVAQIEASLHTAAKHLISHNDAIHAGLGKALDLGHLFAEIDDEWALLKEFLQFHQKPWTAKNDGNFFHGIVTVAFDIIDPKTGKSFTSAPQMSKYRMILKYAFGRGLTGDALVELLSGSTLNDVYSLAAEQARFDPYEKYAEDTKQRFERAQKALLDGPRGDDLPSGKFTKSMKAPDAKTGFVPAMIKLDGNGFKLVKLYSNTSETQVMEDVAALVPAESKLARKSLAQQPGYGMFVTCDFYTRFLPKVANVEDWEKAVAATQRPMLEENPTDEDVNAYMDWWQENRTEPKPHGDDDTQEERDAKAKQLAKKFIPLDALRFEPDGDGWRAQSISTQPFNPYFEVVFAGIGNRVPVDAAMSVPSRFAAQLVDQFPYETPWRYLRKAGGLALQSTSEKNLTFPASDLDDVAAWRTLDGDLKAIANFDLTKPMLQDLDRWKADLAALGLHGRTAFHRFQLLKLDEQQLFLALPDREDHRCALGNLTTEEPDTLPKGLRFFDFHMVRKLIKFAIDYGVAYQVDLLSGHQGLTALKFHALGLPFEASITLPLMLSQKGNPVEINFPR